MLLVGLGQPVCELGDLAFNVSEHERIVRELAAQVIVFPELSLTGYGMDQRAVDPGDERLESLVEACGATKSVALVGAPTASPDGTGRRISMLRVDGDGVQIVYSKMHLGGEEPEHYVPGDEPAVLEVSGWRLGLAICKDNGQERHVAQTVRLGVDVYVAGVCETEDDRAVQPVRARNAIEAHRVWFAYASFAGSTGGGFTDTAGRSAVRDPDGVVRLQLGRSPGQSGLTTLTR